MIDSVQGTIELLINMGAKATTCIVPKPSVHLALMTINPKILKAIFKAGGSPYYTLSNEVLNNFNSLKMCKLITVVSLIIRILN